MIRDEARKLAKSVDLAVNPGINQKSCTWDDVEYITGNGIDIESESLDHGEDICPSRQSSHRIDVLELRRHGSSHVPGISGASCRRNAMFFFIVQCFTQMLKFCELDQISILDEVVVGA